MSNIRRFLCKKRNHHSDEDDSPHIKTKTSRPDTDRLDSPASKPIQVVSIFTSALAIGSVLGFVSAYFLLTRSGHVFSKTPESRHVEDSYNHSHSRIDKLPEVKGDNSSLAHDEEFHKDEDIVVRELARKVRVLCWVLTSSKYHETRAKHVKATWGKRCNILLFVSSENDTTLPAIDFTVEKSTNLWWQTKNAFKYMYANHLDQVDWVLKADDNTYVIVENLRYMLSQYNASEPLYFGCRFHGDTEQGYMTGGAGYVLSKEAVKRVVEEAFPDPEKCREGDHLFEDVEMGKCLNNVNARALDSRDSLGRGRFFPFTPEKHITPKHSGEYPWYQESSYYPIVEGLDCCSDSAITFHGIEPNQMDAMEYLIYHLQPYGI